VSAQVMLPLPVAMSSGLIGNVVGQMFSKVTKLMLTGYAVMLY
jgi:ribosome-associated toxin RatA of RatAB toxin-antitoxin module